MTDETRYTIAAMASMIRELRQKLAAAGVEGSPPPGCETTIGALLSRAQRAEARVRALEAAVQWALGEVDAFPERGEGQGRYWWRAELRRRAGLGASAPTEAA